MKRLACLSLLLAVSGCPDIDTDSGETATAPVVEFDPANRIVPFPNNLLLGALNGKVALPPQCNETPTAKALREDVVNKLDGFGLFKPTFTVTFSETVDMASLTDKIVVYKRATGMTPIDPNAATPIPVATGLAMTVRLDEDCMNPKMVPQVGIVPLLPLEQNSIYTVAILDGVKTASGTAFTPSFTWRIVRTKEDPVTVENNIIVSDLTPLNPADPGDRERLLGIDFLWDMHAGALKFLTEDLPEARRQARDKILLAWEFRTQTTTDPLDPAVMGSAAANVRRDPLLGVETRIPTGVTVEQFLEGALGAGACTQLPCSAVGDVKRGVLRANNYQQETPNPLPGMCDPANQNSLGCPVPGPWTDPAKPALMEMADLGVSIITPVTCPAAGCPTVIFQHGLGRSRDDAFAIALSLAARGFATVAMDAVAHGSRAVRISDTIARGCATPTPSGAPQCYAPFLSPNLAATRDNIRQTVVDHHSLVAALKACSATDCGGFKPDMAKLHYIGQSLGGIIGGVSVATIGDFKSSVLNVPAVGWVDILENTDNLRIRCPLVDSLIDAGILMGEKSNLAAVPPTGLCVGQEWKLQPGYRQFSAIGRWVLDPADPANFTRKLATRRILIQQVDGDAVVPNVATITEGRLIGKAAPDGDADVFAPPDNTAPSAEITTNPMANKWLVYKRQPATGDPAINTFEHGSLLSPGSPATQAGALGLQRMQTDAITFLLLNP